MVFQRPESARLSPEVVTRAVIICAFDAPDPLAFVSSLGYSSVWRALLQLCARR